MKRISVNQVREGPPLTFHEAHQWFLFCSWWTLLSDFQFCIQMNFSWKTEKDVWYQLLRKYFHLLFIKSSLLVLISYLFFQCLLFSLAFITSTLVTSQSYSYCSSVLPQPFLYGEDYSLPFLKYDSHFIVLPFTVVPYYFLLQVHTHLLDLLSVGFLLLPAQFLLDVTLRYFPQDLPLQ